MVDKYKKLIMEVGDIWKTFKDFVGLFQNRFIDELSNLQGKCFEKDAICLDALKKVFEYLFDCLQRILTPIPQITLINSSN